MEELRNGQGIGRALMEYTIESAKPRFSRLELTVRTFNPSAIALYEKCGFEKVGLLKNAAFIDGEFMDELIYQRLL